MDSITSATEPSNVKLFHISSIKHRILIYVQDDFTSKIEIHKKTLWIERTRKYIWGKKIN